MTFSSECSWAVARVCIQQCRVHGTPKLRKSSVISAMFPNMVSLKLRDNSAREIFKLIYLNGNFPRCGTLLPATL